MNQPTKLKQFVLTLWADSTEYAFEGFVDNFLRLQAEQSNNLLAKSDPLYSKNIQKTGTKQSHLVYLQNITLAIHAHTG